MEIVIDNHKAALRLKKRVSELRDDVSVSQFTAIRYIESSDSIPNLPYQRTSKKYNPSLSSRTDLSVVDDEPSSTPPVSAPGILFESLTKQLVRTQSAVVIVRAWRLQYFTDV